jgi:hypothetical protein
MPDGQPVVHLSRGFVVLDSDFDEAEKEMGNLANLWKSNPSVTDRLRSTCTRLAQVLKSSLFPTETYSFGYFEKGGQAFHLDRFNVMRGTSTNITRFHQKLIVFYLATRLDDHFIQSPESQ